MTEEKLRRLVKQEIANSWWAGFVPGEFLQNMAARYFVWKVRRRENE